MGGMAVNRPESFGFRFGKPGGVGEKNIFEIG
jgi:hypothetical protein